MNFGADKQRLGFVQYYAVILGVLTIAFYLGYVTATWRDDGLNKQVKVMQQSLENLTLENQSLNTRINTMKIELDVALLANQQHQKSLQEAHSQQGMLKEQLGFYQRVMAPELSQQGFVVERIEVLPTTSANNYSVSLILLQHESIKDIVQGELDISVSGSLASTPVSYSLAQLQDEPKTKLEFSFKYFQVLSVAFTIPQGFEPQRFDISTDVYKNKRKMGQYNTSILWQNAFSEMD